MKMSRRALRMQKRHARAKRGAGFNMISLMDIFTILVFFLLVNSSEVQVIPNSKAIQLPESVAEQKPRETLLVMVTHEDILLQGERVISVQQITSAQAEISALFAALQAQAANQLLQSSTVDPRGREVTIVADKDIAFDLLKKVMVTCTKAGFSRISLSVLQKGA